MTWISIAERLPEDFEFVLVWFAGGESNVDVANWDSEAKWWSLPNNGFNHPDDEPTHWMPLPDPPEGV